MVSRLDLQSWVVEALRELGGSGSIVEVAKLLWRDHERELRASADLFYTWQYDMRWACTKLRQSKTVCAAESTPKGIWKLAETTPGVITHNQSL
ncbi:hypothetical protein ATI45_3150 [Marinobacter sp. LV10MA510-1]|nr:hypothetical protein ATI45_3150 [Marinobacter sp. LV10MA510-1]